MEFKFEALNKSKLQQDYSVLELIPSNPIELDEKFTA